MPEQGHDFKLEPVEVPRVETRYRSIVTPQPPQGTADLTRRLRKHEPASMSSELPVTWDAASGFQVSDPYGNRWLDFTSGIFVSNAGHAHPRIREAIAGMVDRPLLHNYMFVTEIRARLVAKLVEATPPQLDTVLLLTTGSESTEAAIKMARLYGARTDERKLGIVSLTLGFHGKTMGSQTASGRPAAKQWIGTLDPNLHQIPVPYARECPWGHAPDRECDADCFSEGIAALEQEGVDLETIAGFMVEPYQGWSAAFLPDAYVHAMRRWADERGALLIFDEVQAGIGRTGRLLAHEHFGVEADLVCCGKGLSSSLPISAVLGRRALVDADASFNSTHGGNPVCCAAALANLEVIETEGLLAAAESTGAALGERLRTLEQTQRPYVARVEGRGMVWALHLVDPATGLLDPVLADMVIEQAMRKGVLCVRTGTGTIKIGPPLTMPADAALEGAAVLDEAIQESVARRHGAMPDDR